MDGRMLHGKIRLLFMSIAITVWIIALTRVPIGRADSACRGQSTAHSSTARTNIPASRTYEYAARTNSNVSATSNSERSLKHWTVDSQDQTSQLAFTSNQDDPSQDSSSQGLNIPPNFILLGALAVIVGCCVGYLVPLGLAIRNGKVPANVRKPSLILALLSVFTIAGPLGAALIVYSGNLNGIFTPSNLNNITDAFSGQDRMTIANVTSSYVNLTTGAFGAKFNFTNPTAINLTLIAFSADILDHSDGYSLGNISLATPVTAGANETVTLEVAGSLSAGALAHVETVHADTKSLDVDLSNININLAGVQLQINGTRTINNVPIAR